MYGLSRAIYKAVARKKLSELEELSERVAEIAADSARAQPEGSPTIRT
jgi:hypothetical protein